MPEKLSASMEDYLETILHVVSEKGAARSKDIAQRLTVNKASVTGALRTLSDRGLVNYAPYDVVTLTSSGEALARQVLWRHETLRNFFLRILAVEEEQAEAAACKMEHSLPPVISQRLTRFIDFLDSCPRGAETLARRFSDYCEGTEIYALCDMCKAAEDGIQAKTRT